MWITSGRDFKLRQWNILKGGSILLTLDLHQDEITDCIEIINPSCIVTVSLDGSMVIYDITHKDLIRRVENAHEKGIRGIRYQNYNGAQMITLGHEVYVKVWSPESLVSDIYLGKLESH
jgi:WD40 repeat protein